MEVGFFLLPFLIWYVIPGLNFLIINAAVPIAILDTGVFIHSAGSGGALLIILMGGVSVGFIMDALKIYRWTPGYASRKPILFADLAGILSVSSIDDAGFEQFRAIARSEEPGSPSLEFDHSNWVMINHTSKCFFISSFTWLTIGISSAVAGRPITIFGAHVTAPISQIVIEVGISTVMFMAGWRLQRESLKQCDVTNRRYLAIARIDPDGLRRQLGLTACTPVIPVAPVATDLAASQPGSSAQPVEAITATKEDRAGKRVKRSRSSRARGVTTSSGAPATDTDGDGQEGLQRA